MKQIVPVKKLREGAILPTYGSEDEEKNKSDNGECLLH